MYLTATSGAESLVIFALAAGLMLYRACKYLCYKPVDATVISVEGHGHGKYWYYKHTVQYEYDGMMYESEISSKPKIPFSEGNQVKCIVNPKNPEKVALAYQRTTSLLLGLVALLMAITAAVTL